MYTVTEVINMVRSRLGETTASFWTDSVSEMIAWINDAVEEQYKLASQKWAQAGAPLGHPFIQHYAKNLSTATSEGVSDYTLPTDCSRLFQVEYNSYKAMQVVFAQDYAVKTYPQYEPTVEEAKWAFINDRKIRLYVTPGSATVPISTVTFKLDYLRKTTRLTSTAGTVTVDCPEEYISGPVTYIAAKCLEKNRDDASPFWAQFQKEVDSIA